MSRIVKAILSIGPGILAIGYPLFTGSVTSMIVAGSTFGMSLRGVLLLSCLFSGSLLHACGKFARVTGEPALHASRQYCPVET